MSKRSFNSISFKYENFVTSGELVLLLFAFLSQLTNLLLWCLNECFIYMCLALYPLIPNVYVLLFLVSSYIEFHDLDLQIVYFHLDL